MESLDDETTSSSTKSFMIGSVTLTEHLSWKTLDASVRQLFVDYVGRWDSLTFGLGLDESSVFGYQLGEVVRKLGSVEDDPGQTPLECSVSAIGMRLYLKGQWNCLFLFIFLFS